MRYQNRKQENSGTTQLTWQWKERWNTGSWNVLSVCSSDHFSGLSGHMWVSAPEFSQCESVRQSGQRTSTPRHHTWTHWVSWQTRTVLRQSFTDLAVQSSSKYNVRLNVILKLFFSSALAKCVYSWSVEPIRMQQILKTKHHSPLQWRQLMQTL